MDMSYSYIVHDEMPQRHSVNLFFHLIGSMKEVCYFLRNPSILYYRASIYKQTICLSNRNVRYEITSDTSNWLKSR